MAKVLKDGNNAIAEAALMAGCKAYFGYPITPQSEIGEYLSRHMPESNGIFVAAESEIGAINMVFGAGSTGVRAMTSTSSTALNLMLEGIATMVLARVPGVIVNVVRTGPGLGNLDASQDDYDIHANGSYRIPTFLPNSVQEAMEMTIEAFDVADKYRTPVMVVADGRIAKMMEGVDVDALPKSKTEELPEKTWAVNGRSGKGHKTAIQHVSSGSLPWTTTYYNYYKAMDELFSEVYPEIEKNERRWEQADLETADIVLVGYGSSSRMMQSVIEDMKLSHPELRLGFIRPKMKWPFCEPAFDDIGANCKAIVCAEINFGGQLINDVRLAANGRWPVFHAGNTMHGMLTEKNIKNKVLEVWEECK